MARHCLCHCRRAACASGVVCRRFQSPAAAWPVRFSLRDSSVAPGQIMNLITLFTFCGLAYMLIEAIGATSLAAISPPLIEGYGQASVQQRQVDEVVFSGFL